MRGVYYIARYRHRPEDGEDLTVTLDQYCGRTDPDADTNAEAEATARRIDEVDERVTAAVAQAGGRSIEARSHKAGRSFDAPHVSVQPNTSVVRGAEPLPTGVRRVGAGTHRSSLLFRGRCRCARVGDGHLAALARPAFEQSRSRREEPFGNRRAMKSNGTESRDTPSSLCFVHDNLR